MSLVHAHVFWASHRFFIVYQIADAVRSARAIQTGQPTPDPFGLGQVFSPGQKMIPAKSGCCCHIDRSRRSLPAVERNGLRHRRFLAADPYWIRCVGWRNPPRPYGEEVFLPYKIPNVHGPRSFDHVGDSVFT